MTYTVLSGTLNSSIPYHLYVTFLSVRSWSALSCKLLLSVIIIIIIKQINKRNKINKVQSHYCYSKNT